MKFVLFRHGETDSNALNVIQGAGLNTPLNARGIFQARQLSEQAAQMGLEKIYSSNLLRALQTATLSAAACGLAVMPVDGLEEFHYGEAEGLSIDDAIVRYGKEAVELVRDWTNPQRLDFCLPGGESIRQCQARVMSTLENIKRENEGKAERIGIFTHGAVMCYLYELHFEQFREFRNCEFFELEL